MTKLSDDEIKTALGDLPGWDLAEGALSKEFKFPSFMDAIAFIDRVAERAEEIDHHPDFHNHNNRVRVSLFTWSEKAITEKDVGLAHHIETVADSGF